MISHFSQEPFEGTFHIEDADLQKMAKVLNDVNIKECPYFDLSDKYGNSARYYRENQWILCSERLPKQQQTVLIQDFGQITLGYLNAENRWRNLANLDDYLKGVVAWMPLPEPYEEKEQ